MTSADPHEALRDAIREVLRELMPGMLGERRDGPRGDRQANGSGHAETQVGHDRRLNGYADRVQPAGSDATHGSAAPREDAVIVPEVPAPPVAAVLRPSTWNTPAAPGEVIGDRPRGSATAVRVASDAQVEPVTIDTDEDLEHFVRALAARIEDPRDRLAIRAGRVRFSLRRSAATSAATDTAPTQLGAARVVKGAVTERTVRTAAADGARLLLTRSAVLTPLARDCARALGVEIERERRC